MLAAEVVQADHELEKAANRSAGELARHRWHWTLDETNPGRINVNAYAREVSRNRQTIYVMAHGYARFIMDQSMTLEEHTAQARMSGETRAAAEAVGHARGVSAKTAQEQRREEVRRVREMARERAEKQGTTVEEEAAKAAQQIKTQEEADTELAEQRKARLGLRYVEVEDLLSVAYRKVSQALGKMRDMPWEDEHRELLSASAANIKAVLALIDVALTGAADVDWDAEMAKLS
jgi:hypothetical protein